MLKKLNYILISFLIISCTSEHIVKEYYNSGNLKTLKTFDEDNNLVIVKKYYDLPDNKIFSANFIKSKYDSIVYYYNNGGVFTTGKQDKSGKLFGKWNRYTRENFLSDTREFFITNKESNLNQLWYYNKKGDTLYYGNNKFNIYNQREFKTDRSDIKRSIFVRFKFSPNGDTLSIASPLRAIAYDNFPILGKSSECYIVLAKEKFNFNKDFSNETETKLDTFHCLEKDKLNEKNYPNMDKKYSVAFGRWFDTPGRKILRGYMVEYRKRKPTPDDSIVKQERRTYFEKIIYVKDTVN
jgi:hypothetical protein